MYKIFLICLFASYFIFMECDRKLQVFNNGSRFRSVECEADNYTTSVNLCYIKPISRRVTTLYLHLKSLRPSYKPIYIQMILYYRYGTIYREVIDTKRVEWCSIMEGISGHLFLMQIIRQIKEIAANAIHKCPYDSDIEVKNLTLDDSKSFDIFPEGIYKFSWITVNKTLNILWRFNVSLQVKSQLKEIMGYKFLNFQV